MTLSNYLRILENLPKGGYITSANSITEIENEAEKNLMKLSKLAHVSIPQEKLKNDLLNRILENTFKKMFCVDYSYADGRSTFSIFPTLEQAEEFVNTSFGEMSECVPTRLWKADLACDCLYEESDGTWNYEDFSHLVNNEEDIRILCTELPAHFLN